MAYLDDMATEREKTRAKMLEGKTPLLGEDTSRALHALGVSLGVVPAGSPPGQFEQLLASLVGPIKGVKVDDYKSPQYNPQSGTRASGGGGGGGYSGGGGGDGLSGLSDMMSKAKDSALAKLLEEKRKAEQGRPGSAPGSSGGGASVRDRSVSGAAARAQRHRDNTPGPYAKGEAATQWAREQIPGLKPDDSSGGVTSTANAYITEKTPGPGVRGVERGAATGDRILPGADLKGVDPRIAEIVGAAAEGLPAGYKVKPTSGVRATGHGQHTKSAAADWEIVKSDGKGGWEAIPNRGDDSSGLYTKLAKNAYGYQEKNHPDLTGKFQWGGQFGTSARNPNEPDLMHFDIGGRRGRITKYSRESIGAELPPAAKGAAAPPPAWDKGLPKGADPKTAWADPNKATLPGSDKLELAATTAASGGGAALSPQLLEAIKSVESGGNPNAVKGSYKGLYQLSDKQFADYGGKGSIFDPAENTRVAKLIIADEAKNLSKELGRPVTASEIYMAHQQGFGGAAAHLKNPDQPAWKSMASTGEGRQRGEAWAREAIWGNVPDDLKAKYGSVDNITSKQFVEMWKQRGAEHGITDKPGTTTEVSTAPPGGPEQGIYRDTVRGYQGAPGQAPAPAPQVHPQNPQTAQLPQANQPPPPQTTAPPPQAPAQRAPTPAPPPASAPAPTPQPPPAPKGPTGVQKANAFLDMKAMDLIRRDSPENDTFITRQYVGDRTVRQMMGDPMASGKMKENLPLAAKKYGFTPQDFDAAMHGKRAEGGPAQTSDQLLAQAQGQTQPSLEPDKTRYAQADTGTMTDAGPQPPAAGGAEAAEALKTALSKPDAGAAPAAEIVDRRGEIGGPRRDLAMRAGIEEPHIVYQGWARDAEPVPPNELSRALGSDEIAKIEASKYNPAMANVPDIRTHVPGMTYDFMSRPGPQGAAPKEETVPGLQPGAMEQLRKFAEEHPDVKHIMPEHPLPDTPENRAAFAAENRRMLEKLLKENPNIVNQAPVKAGDYPHAPYDPGGRYGTGEVGGEAAPQGGFPEFRQSGSVDDRRGLPIQQPTIRDFALAARDRLMPPGEAPAPEPNRLSRDAGMAEILERLGRHDEAARWRVDDRRDAPGGARRELAARLGIDQASPADKDWAGKAETPPSELSSALGGDDLARREVAAYSRQADAPAVAQPQGFFDEPSPSQLSQFAGTARAQSPSLTPEMIKALQSVFKDAGVPEKGVAPPPPDAQPVLPSQVAPMPQAPPGGGGGGLSLAPSGLNTGPVEAGGAPPSQGAPIAMAGLMPLPPIQDTTWTPPSSNLSPIPWDTVSDWGGGGGFGGFGGFGAFGGF